MRLTSLLSYIYTLLWLWPSPYMLSSVFSNFLHFYFNIKIFGQIYCYPVASFDKLASFKALQSGKNSLFPFSLVFVIVLPCTGKARSLRTDQPGVWLLFTEQQVGLMFGFWFNFTILFCTPKHEGQKVRTLRISENKAPLSLLLFFICMGLAAGLEGGVFVEENPTNYWPINISSPQGCGSFLSLVSVYLSIYLPTYLAHKL